MADGPKTLSHEKDGDDARRVGFANAFVSTVLRSPVHGLLSRSTALVRYTGNTSGTVFSTPVQYVRSGDGLIVLVGRSERKTWWRNFRVARSVDVLVDGRWLPMTGQAIEGASKAEAVVPLLEAYLHRFPKAGRLLPGSTMQERAAGAVVVWCQPRLARVDPAGVGHTHTLHLPRLPVMGTDAEPG